MMCWCLPQHNKLSVLHWHFGGGGGGDVFLLWGVHWAQLGEGLKEEEDGRDPTG